MRRVLYFDGVAHPVRVEPGEDGASVVHLPGEPAPIRVAWVGGVWRVTRGRQTVEASVTRHPGELTVETGAARYRFQTRRAKPGAGGSTGGGRVEVRPPMPGKVVRVLRGNGDRVSEGQGVLVYEAMKMQNEICAPAAGTLSGLRVTEGSPLSGAETLFVVEPSPEPSP